MFAPKKAGDRAPRSALIQILQMAYSGERAAAFAYQGHWRSVQSAAQKTAIQKIEADEWEHRRDLGVMLAELGAKPVWWREIQMAFIGRTVAIGCFLIGWFFPMYLAGQLESNNIDEYDIAAEYANALDLQDLVRDLRVMAATEKDHETYFATMVVEHPWLPFANAVFGWHPERRLQLKNSAYENAQRSRFLDVRLQSGKRKEVSSLWF